LEELKSKGVAINTVDKAAFTKAVQPVIEKFSAEIGDDVMNLLK
jgi:TRAP-type C4-dicarboxylate transport system substrate-binding protein